MVTITGTEGNDIIDEAAEGADSEQPSNIQALGGDDLIIALPKFDTISPIMTITDTVDGGAGNDTYRIAAGNAWSLSNTRYEQALWAVDLTAVENFEVIASGHGTATLGAGDDSVDARSAGFSPNGNYTMGDGDDEVMVRFGTVNAAMGAGDDRLVLDQATNAARTNLTGTLTGSLATGYSGTYNRSDGASTFATISFSGVENFTINTTGGSNINLFDTIVTGDGDDIISTGAGNDTITVAKGDDTVDGGAEIDALSIDLSDETAGATIDLLRTGEQQTKGTGSITNVESFFGAVVGSGFKDILIETAGENADSRNAQFSMGAGNDFVQVSRGTDSVDMGAGNDRLVLEHSYNNARTNLTGTLTGSLATGYSGTYNRSDGASTFATVTFSGVENFTINTTAGSNINAFDTIVTGDGDDIISTGAGNDTVNTAGGRDLIDGGAGNDTLRGEIGRDLLHGGLGNDLIDGGGGFDTAFFIESDRTAGVIVDLVAGTATGEGGSELDTLASIERVYGTSFADTMTAHRGDQTFAGRDGDDALNAGKGNDALLGDEGDDELIGAKGNDTLAGGAGRDTLNGGLNDDRFDLASLDAADADKIIDFGNGADMIGLDSDVFGLPEGALLAARFTVGAQAGDANDRLIYNDASGKLFFDADGTGAQAQVLIATFTGAPSISASDFIVI